MSIMNSHADYSAFPDDESSTLAHASAQALSALLAKIPEAERAQIKLDGENIILPKHALELLRDLLSEMAQGNAVTIVPMHAELTTQEAADMLNVSRPYLIKLLNEGKIAHHKVNKHRRIKFSDLTKYKEQLASEQEDALSQLAAQAQELDMGY